MIDNCGCLAIHLAVHKTMWADTDLPLCANHTQVRETIGLSIMSDFSDLDLDTVRKTFGRLYCAYVSSTYSEDNILEDAIARCRQPCESYIYDTTVSSVPWPQPQYLLSFYYL